MKQEERRHGRRGKIPTKQVLEAHVQIGMTDKEYKELLGSIEAALRIVGDEPSQRGVELKIRSDLMKLRETLIRARRDRIKDKTGRPDSRSPLGVP
jgi:hypothetical protein